MARRSPPPWRRRSSTAASLSDSPSQSVAAGGFAARDRPEPTEATAPANVHLLASLVLWRLVGSRRCRAVLQRRRPTPANEAARPELSAPLEVHGRPPDAWGVRG